MEKTDWELRQDSHRLVVTRYELVMRRTMTESEVAGRPGEDD